MLTSSTNLHSVTKSLPNNSLLLFLYIEYLTQIIFIIGAYLSSIKSKKRVNLLNKQSGLDSIDRFI